MNQRSDDFLSQWTEGWMMYLYGTVKIKNMSGSTSDETRGTDPSTTLNWSFGRFLPNWFLIEPAQTSTFEAEPMGFGRSGKISSRQKHWNKPYLNSISELKDSKGLLNQWENMWQVPRLNYVDAMLRGYRGCYSCGASFRSARLSELYYPEEKSRHYRYFTSDLANSWSCKEIYFWITVIRWYKLRP